MSFNAHELLSRMRSGNNLNGGVPSHQSVSGTVATQASNSSRREVAGPYSTQGDDHSRNAPSISQQPPRQVIPEPAPIQQVQIKGPTPAQAAAIQVTYAGIADCFSVI